MQRLSRRPFLAVLALALPALSLSARADEAPFAPVPADQVVEADLLFLRRPVIVFADSPYAPAFIRQMELLARSYAALAARDVILITDTDPANPSSLRKKLRPRGFSLVLILFAGIRERVEGADVPIYFRGVAIAMVTAGLMALAFMGFAGLDKYQ